MSTRLASDPTADTWAAVWEKHPEVEDDEVCLPMMETLESLGTTGKLICEVGCGRGKESMRLQRLGARVVCVDFTETALHLVRRGARNLEAPEPNLVSGDTFRLPFRDGTFDAMFHQGLLEHFRDPVA